MEVPTAANGQVTSVQSASAAPAPADDVRADDVCEIPVHTQPKPLSTNYFARHWRGELSLGVSYWRNGVAITFLFAFAIAILTELNNLIDLRLYAAVTIFTFVLVCGVSVWQIVGTWRSASLRTSRGGSPTWAAIAKFFLFLGAARTVLLVVNTYVPQSIEMTSILFGDSKMPPYTITVLPDGKEVEFSGGIRAGAGSKFESVLRSAPMAQTLRINSTGGRMAEASRIASAVRERHLNTYVRGQCLSAATIILIAGTDRTLHEDGKIGFHTGAFPAMLPDQKRYADDVFRREMERAGITAPFIAKVMATPPSEMFYPTPQEMRTAGVITKEEAPMKVLASGILKMMSDESETSLQFERTGNRDADSLLAVVAGFVGPWKKTFVEMDDQLDKLGEPEIFTRATLESRQALRSAMETYSRRTNVIEQCRAKAQEHIADATRAMGALTVGDPAAKAMQRGVENSIKTQKAQADQVLNLRVSVEQVKASFVAFMEEVFDQYSFNGPRISFRRSEHISVYNSHADAIDSASADLAKFQRQLLNSVGTNVQTLQKMSR
jgi:hypothetical protein